MLGGSVIHDDGKKRKANRETRRDVEQKKKKKKQRRTGHERVLFSYVHSKHTIVQTRYKRYKGLRRTRYWKLVSRPGIKAISYAKVL